MLSERRKGRLERLQDSVSNNDLGEAGLVEALVQSLNDRYVDLAKYVAASVLPSFGASALPHLKRHFNRDGNSSDALRLIAIRSIDSAEARKLASQALPASHKRLRAEAFATLNGSADHAELLLSFVGSRSSHVRECAFKALSGIQSNNVVRNVCHHFHKGVRESSWAMRNTCNSDYANAIADVLGQTLQSRSGIFPLKRIESVRLIDCWRAS
jgi:hypothetical protein